MHSYIHKVHYYETDKMSITHHSNYVRWMEEARTDFLDKHGYGYVRFEENGLVSPVLSVSCNYKHTTTFGDEISIQVKVEKYTGIKLAFAYEMTNVATGTVVFTGKTEHCFVDTNGYPVIVRKRLPEFHKVLEELAQE